MGVYFNPTDEVKNFEQRETLLNIMNIGKG